MYGKGISRMAEILDLAVEFDIIQKRGSWYRYDGEPIGQGSDNAIEFLESDPELIDKIEEQILREMNPEKFEDEEETKDAKKEDEDADEEDES